MHFQMSCLDHLKEKNGKVHFKIYTIHVIHIQKKTFTLILQWNILCTFKSIQKVLQLISQNHCFSFFCVWIYELRGAKSPSNMQQIDGRK